MRTAAPHLEAEQRRLWTRYAERLRDLEGAEYVDAETVAWEELQAGLRMLGIPGDTADHRPVWVPPGPRAHARVVNMESMDRNRRASAAVALTICALAGCGGGEDDFANEPRPPSPIVVAARIGDDRVSVSPATFGAGPVTLIVTNQTERSQELTLETDEIAGSAPGIEQSSGPINPGDTAQLQADLREGTYSIGVDGRGIDAARLEVGEERPSSQDELLQP